MAVPTTFNVSTLLRSLGVKGGSLPELQAESYTPVMVMGDFSKTLSSEPLEARGLCAENIAGGIAPAVGMVELQAIAGGGLVLEYLRVYQPTVPGNYTLMQLLVSGTSNLAGAPLAEIQNIGGRAVRSVVRYSNIRAEVVGPTFSTFVGLYKEHQLGPMRIYLPPGWFLFIQAGHMANDLAFEFAWREIPDPIGTP